ncbi:hypothetical protein CGK35_17035 [Vibrio parahaemolyticus]|nr:hypothetical protein CGK35_17035 [Vibrio parahaemolyticus]
MMMNLSEIEENGAANFSRLLVSPHATLQQQRIMASAVAAFVPTDKFLISALNSHMNNLEVDLIKIHKNVIKGDDRESELIELKKNDRLMENTYLESGEGSEPSIQWDQLGLLECASIFFCKHPSYLQFSFNLRDFVSYWSPDSRINIAPSRLSESIAQAASSTNFNTAFEYKYDKNGKRCRDVVPIFSRIQLIEGNEVVSVELNPRFMPFLVFYCQDLKRIGYTALPLYLVKSAKSEFTMRMWLVLLRRYHLDTGTSVREINVTIQELREEMGTTNRYKNGSDFCKHVVHKSLNEINEISQDPDVSEKALKIVTQKNGELFKVETRGRRIVGVSITIDPSGLANEKAKSKSKGKGKGKGRSRMDRLEKLINIEDTRTVEEEIMAIKRGSVGSKEQAKASFKSQPEIMNNSEPKPDGIEPTSDDVALKGVTDTSVDERATKVPEKPKAERDSDLFPNLSENSLF